MTYGRGGSQQPPSDDQQYPPQDYGQQYPPEQPWQPPALTGKALEADLSAFFVENGLLGNQCGAAVFAYHSMSDYQANNDNGFTAGRVILSNNSGSSPQFNLEVDTGAATDEQATFNFNF